jgi:Lsr2
MNIYPLSWLSPTRIGFDVEHLLNRSVTLARVMLERLVDDADSADGAGGTQTIPFAYRGTQYEIELSAKDVKALEAALAPYVANARPVTVKRTNPRRSPVKSSVPAGPSQVRAWAKTQGIAVADRGRVSADVMRQYRDAHGG